MPHKARPTRLPARRAVPQRHQCGGHSGGHCRFDAHHQIYFAGAQVKYVGRQFSTFMNDQAMPGYVDADMNFGYRAPKLWRARPELRLNLMNVGDNKYLSGPAGIAPSARATRGIYGTMIGATGTPTYYVAGGFAAMITASTGF
ncbi:hypothetical protein AAC691_20805 [Nguyenibacter vanlangensis]|uniref:TonB-dependent receptor-like beta-barrel domain-containing protein n=1 Tax=Nguyenibacter vanlangensis TaxID=1216886 RepID=A0ABZ3D4I3_9PROT